MPVVRLRAARVAMERAAVGRATGSPVAATRYQFGGKISVANVPPPQRTARRYEILLHVRVRPSDDDHGLPRSTAYRYDRAAARVQVTDRVYCCDILL